MLATYSFLKRIDKYKLRFKYKPLGLALGLGMSLKFYTRVAKGLKLKVKSFLGKFLRFQKFQRKNWLVGEGGFAPAPAPAPPPLSILNRVKLLAELHHLRLKAYILCIFSKLFSTISHNRQTNTKELLLTFPGFLINHCLCQKSQHLEQILHQNSKNQIHQMTILNKLSFSCVSC